MTKRSLKNLSADDRYELLVAEEDLILEGQMLIQRALNERGMSQKELADLLGVGQSYVSQMLGLSGRNLTLRTIARAMHALGGRAEIRLHVEGSGEPSDVDASTGKEVDANEARLPAARMAATLTSSAWDRVVSLPSPPSRGSASDARDYASYDPAYLEAA